MLRTGLELPSGRVPRLRLFLANPGSPPAHNSRLQLPIFEITLLPDAATDVLTLPFQELPAHKFSPPSLNFIDPCFLPAQEYKLEACRVHAPGYQP